HNNEKKLKIQSSNPTKTCQISSQSLLNESHEYKISSDNFYAIVKKPSNTIDGNKAIEKKNTQDGIFLNSLYVFEDKTEMKGNGSQGFVPKLNSHTPSSLLSFTLINSVRNAIYLELVSLMIDELKKYFEDNIVCCIRPTEKFLLHLLETL
ncbi:hypothetical protein NPIL_457341, partial [Nephila pilipes]